MAREDVAEDILRGEEKLTKDKSGHLDSIQNENHYRQGIALQNTALLSHTWTFVYL